MKDQTEQYDIDPERLLHFGFTREQQPDGTYKWYAIHPQTHERVEIDPNQAWFWTKEWQEGERKVDEYLLRGQYQDFDDVDKFFDTRLPDTDNP